MRHTARHTETLRALGVPIPEPQAPEPRRETPTEPSVRVTLDGGYQQPPPVERDHEGEHNRLLVAMTQAPPYIPPLERS